MNVGAIIQYKLINVRGEARHEGYSGYSGIVNVC